MDHGPARPRARRARRVGGLPQPAVQDHRVPHRLARAVVPRGSPSPSHLVRPGLALERCRSCSRSSASASRTRLYRKGLRTRPNDPLDASSGRSHRSSATPTTTTRPISGSSTAPGAARRASSTASSTEDHRRRGQRRRAARQARRARVCATCKTASCAATRSASWSAPSPCFFYVVVVGRLTVATDFPILSAIIAVPYRARCSRLFMPSSRPELAKAIGYATTTITLGLAAWLLWNFSDDRPRLPVRRDTEPWIRALGRPLHRRRRRHQPVHGRAHRAAVPDRPARVREVHRRTASKAYTRGSCSSRARSWGSSSSLDLIVFFVFWELDARPDVLPHPGMGKRAARVRGDEVLPLHGGGLGVPARGDARARVPPPGRHRRCSPSTSACSPSGTASPGTTEVVLFLGFMAAFAIKAPLFPFHTWLPDVHTEAPTAGSVVLAGVILKMGTYGFLRFSFELFPQASVDLAPLLLVLAVIGIIYGAIVAAMQTDLKRLIAYSSVAHMGFVVLGIFSLTVIGIDGAVFTMLSHALTTGALFLVVGMLYERRHTRRDQRVPRDLEGRADPRRAVPHRAVRRHRPARLLRVHRRVPVAARRVPVRPPVRDRRHDRRDLRRACTCCGRSSARSPASRRARTRRSAT